MKQFLVILFAWLLPVLGLQAQVPDKPSPQRLVNDYAGVLEPGQINTLERKLVKYNDSTSTQIAVVIVQSLGGLDIFDFAQELFQKWNIGTDKNNNGVLLLISIDDRKTRIHTGYGAEATITDAFSSDVLNNILKPAFKEGKYYDGINAATTAIIQKMAGEYKAEPKSLSWKTIVKILLFIILLIVVMRWLSKGSGDNFGAGFGTGYFFGSGWGGGGGSSGGSWGDSGGFGGFGGGDSGGGGASGDW